MEEVIIFFWYKSKHLFNIIKELIADCFFSINSDKYFYAAKITIIILLQKRSYLCPWLLESDLGSVMPDKTLIFFAWVLWPLDSLST